MNIDTKDFEKIFGKEIKNKLLDIKGSLNSIDGISVYKILFINDLIYIYINFESIKSMNRFIWAGTKRFFNISHRSGWILQIDISDPHRDCENIKAILRMEENINFEDKINDLFLSKTGIREWGKISI